MEIIIKAKQKFNPFFSFLNYEDALFPYYTHIKDMIQTGAYVPQNKPMGAAKGVTNGSSGMSRVNANQLRDGASNEQKKDLRHDLPAVKISSPKHGDTNKELNSTESDSDDSDSDDGGYLHPLLMKASLKSSKPSTPEPAPSPPVPPSRAPPPISEKKLSVEELMNLHNKSSFVARSLAINSAPSLNQDMSTHGQATPSPSTYSEADAMAAYEHYKQQYYDR